MSSRARNKNAKTEAVSETTRSDAAAATTVAAGGAPASSVFRVTAETRRVLPTLDLFSAEQVGQEEVAALAAEQERAATHFYVGLNTLREHFAVSLLTRIRRCRNR